MTSRPSLFEDDDLGLDRFSPKSTLPTYRQKPSGRSLMQAAFQVEQGQFTNRPLNVSQ